MTIRQVGAGIKAATQPLSAAAVAAVEAAVPAPAPQAAAAKDAKAVKTQTEKFDAAPPVDLQEVVLPQDLANNTGMSSTSTGGSKGGGPRRADASDAEAFPRSGTDLADNTNMSTTSTPAGSPKPRPRPGGGVKAQAAMG